MPRLLAASLKVAAAAAATFLALALIAWLVLYGAIAKIHKDWARSVVQVACGRSVEDPRLYTLTPGTCRFANAEYDTVLTVDADGYRNAPAISGIGAVKVAIAGDSHALGWGVADSESFPARLARHPELSVHNLAMSSYGTARELLTLRMLAPDAAVVILQYCDNDLRENETFLRDPAAFAAMTGTQQAMPRIFERRDRKGFSFGQLRQRMVLRLFGGFAWVWSRLGLPRRDVGAAVKERQDLPAEALAFARVMAANRDYLAGRRVIVFESNNWGNLRPGFAAAFGTALAAHGLPAVEVIDLSRVLTRASYYHIDEHLTAAGHLAVADRLYAVWRDQR